MQYLTLLSYTGTEKVDVLVNNAGIVFHPCEKTTEGFEMHFVTNYLGKFILTQILDTNYVYVWKYVHDNSIFNYWILIIIDPRETSLEINEQYLQALHNFAF